MIWFFWFNSVGCESNIFWVLLAESQIYMHLQELLLKLLVLLSSMKFSKNYLLPPLFDLLVIILIQCSLLSMVTNSYQSISWIAVLSHSIAESDRLKKEIKTSLFSQTYNTEMLFLNEPCSSVQPLGYTLINASVPAERQRSVLWTASQCYFFDH